VRLIGPDLTVVTQWTKSGATVDDGLTYDAATGIVRVAWPSDVADDEGMYRFEFVASDGYLTGGVRGHYRQKFRLMELVSVSAE
jgi:hypothetical protein